MKKQENLGKSLNRHEKKNIMGGAVTTVDLYCNTSFGGPYTFIWGWATMAKCMVDLNAKCYPGGPYYSCYCGSPDPFVTCQP